MHPLSVVAWRAVRFVATRLRALFVIRWPSVCPFVPVRRIGWRAGRLAFKIPSAPLARSRLSPSIRCRSEVDNHPQPNRCHQHEGKQKNPRSDISDKTNEALGKGNGQENQRALQCAKQQPHGQYQGNQCDRYEPKDFRIAFEIVHRPETILHRASPSMRASAFAAPLQPVRGLRAFAAPCSCPRETCSAACPAKVSPGMASPCG